MSQNTIQLLSLLGVGTVCSLIVTAIFSAIHDLIKRKHLETKDEREARWKNQQKKLDDIQQAILELNAHIQNTTDTALQAILRNKLYEIYDRSIAKNSVTQDDRDNFINLYEKYHALGKNGVMDAKKDAFLKLDIDNTRR